MNPGVLKCLLWCVAVTVTVSDELTFATGFYSKTPQKLSKYSWFGSVRLYQFRVPGDAVLVRWMLTVTRGSGFNCGDQNVTVHLRAGAPPVINPVRTAFPNDTALTLAQNLTLRVLSSQTANVTLLNVSLPVPGDWYIAAHLPKDDGKIQQQGLPSCSYLFQPQMFVRRAVDTPVLQPNIPLIPTLTSSNSPALFKVFVPEFSSGLNTYIQNCKVGGVAVSDCGLSVSLGSSSLERDSVVSVNCTREEPCTASVSSPPWNTWVRVAVETSQPNVTMTFSIFANYTEGCKPPSAPADFNTSLGIISSSLSLRNTSVTPGNLSQGSLGNSTEGTCMRSPSVFREDLDVLSLRFTVASGNLSVSSDLPTLLTLDLDSPTDSAGTLILQLNLNASSPIGRFSKVRACLTASAPVLHLNTSRPCATAFQQGYPLSVDSNQTETLLRVPFPDAAVWYLSLQTLCSGSGGCSNVTAVVSVSASVSACIDDCGRSGDCRLLRSHSYLYAACGCKTGWQGWGCTDGSAALSYSRQLLAAMLLTLSNLLFLPPIGLALYRGYLTESAVYLFTMFFSTFYHACDQPGVTVLCIMDYDTLQFCDFLGSVAAVWVTLICMARLEEPIKYVFFVVGTLLIAMAMQLDRRGLWNLLGPIMFALFVMAMTWGRRGVKRRTCYPPSWRRWVFFLLPGLLSALIGVCVYAFAQTDSNYYYTHSLWHMLVATSVVFLMPPREKHVPPWGLSHKICGYKICKNQKEELYTVT